MTASELAVFLDGTRAGSLIQSAPGNLAFAYDPAYRERNDATPLSLSMPLTAAVHKKRVVLPWLQGLLPDNDDALRAIGRRFGVSPANPFALLEHIGADAAGAVQILPPDVAATDATVEQKAHPVTDAEVAVMLDHAVAEYTEGVTAPDAGGRFSIAGALFREGDGTWAVPGGSLPTTHILKPVVGAFRRIDVVEQMTLHAARHLGCDVATAQLMTVGGWNVLVSERYDRVEVGGRWRRPHQEDLCQALAVPPAKRYQQRDGGPGVAKVAQLLASLPLVADRAEAGSAFFRAFVFNVVAGGTDAHAKNYSLLLAGRSVRLAPLYDLLTYAGYGDGSARLSSAMSVDGEYAFDRISSESLVRTGARFGVARDDAAAVIEGMREGIVGAFDAAHDQVTGFGPDAAEIADAVTRGIRRLPLVPGR